MEHIADSRTECVEPGPARPGVGLRRGGKGVPGAVEPEPQAGFRVPRPLEHRFGGLGQELDEVLVQQLVAPGGDPARVRAGILVGQPVHEEPLGEGLQHRIDDLGRESDIPGDLLDRSRPLGIRIADQLPQHQYRGRTRRTRLTGGVVLGVLDENLVDPQLTAPAS